MLEAGNDATRKLTAEMTSRPAKEHREVTSTRTSTLSAA